MGKVICRGRFAPRRPSHSAESTRTTEVSGECVGEREKQRRVERVERERIRERERGVQRERTKARE